MSTTKHIINKVFFEVNTSDTKTAYYLKDNLDMFLKQNLLPTIQAYFDSVASIKNQIIRFDKLELSIDTANAQDQVQLQLDIVKSLQKQVVLKKEANTSISEDSSFSIFDKEKSDAETFFYFLETGQIPWWDSNNNLADKNFIEAVISNKSFQSKFRECITSKIVRQRLVYQFSDKMLLKIIAQNNVLKQFPKSLQKDVFREKYWEIIIKYIADKNLDSLRNSLAFLFLELIKEAGDYKTFNKIISDEVKAIFKSEKQQTPKQRQKSTSLQNILIKDLERIIVKELKSIQTLNIQVPEEEVYHKLKHALKENIDAKILEKLIKTCIQRVKEILKEEFKKTTDEIVSFSSKLISEKLEFFQYDDVEKVPFESQKKQSLEFTTERTSKLDTSVYIQNAGLLILHPYLSRFFTTIKFLDAAGKIKSDKIELAIHLLHYLATKKEKQAESNLVFEKFICGYPMDKPIRKNIRLPQNLKKEAESLLESVLRNWQILKNTSTDGLRENFMKRAGKLILDDESKYRIVVERKTQDILLEKLPWNLTIVRLPWIDRLIFVEW